MVAEDGVPALLAHPRLLVRAQNGKADAALDEVNQGLGLADDAVVEPVLLRDRPLLALADLADRGDGIIVAVQGLDVSYRLVQD